MVRPIRDTSPRNPVDVALFMPSDCPMDLRFSFVQAAREQVLARPSGSGSTSAGTRETGYRVCAFAQAFHVSPWHGLSVRCGRGACLCRSAADICQFVLSGHRSPDSIYVLQEHVFVPRVVRVELVFGQPLYGLEILNGNEPASWAPCGCQPLDLDKQPHTPQTIITPAKTVAGCALSALLGALLARLPKIAVRKLRFLVLGMLALFVALRRRRRSQKQVACPQATLLDLPELTSRYGVNVCEVYFQKHSQV